MLRWLSLAVKQRMHALEFSHDLRSKPDYILYNSG
jgi:hypothetical protein